MADKEAFTVKIEGLEALDRKLRELPEKVGRRAMRRALRKGATIVRREARSGAQKLDDPRTSNSIAKNIAIRNGGTKRERAEGGPVLRVGVLGGARDYSAHGEIGTGKSGKENPGGSTFYWRFLEFGTQSIAPRGFMRSAMERSTSKVFDAVATAMSSELDKELRKAGAL